MAGTSFQHARHKSSNHATGPISEREGVEIGMPFIYPPETFVVALTDYGQPYENPIEVKAVDLVHPVTDGSMETNFVGWTWCVGPDARAGWTPDSWCEPMEEGWRITRDFFALEFTVQVGDRLRLLHSESGFLFCEADTGERARVPDLLTCLQDFGPF